MARPIAPTDISLAYAPKRREDVTSIQLEGEMVVYEPDGATMHKLDPIATALWNLFDGRTPLAELAPELADIFATDSSTVERDLVGYARQLGASGLLDGVAPDDRGGAA